MQRERRAEVRGIDFTLWLHSADSLPLIIPGGVEELISYRIIMEGFHLSPRKPDSPTSSWSIIRAAVTAAEPLGEAFNQPVGWKLSGPLCRESGWFLDFSSEQRSKVTMHVGICSVNWTHIPRNVNNASLSESIFICSAVLRSILHLISTLQLTNGC